MKRLKMCEWILFLSANVIAGAGALADLKYHKIFNKITLPSMMAGLLINLFIFGLNGLKNSFLGILMGAVFGIFWIFGMLKAGDIKLYMALGAFGGWRFCVYTMIFSVLAGGVAATILMIMRKTGRESLKRMKLYLTNLFYTKVFKTYEPESSKGYFSFGGCIYIGTVLASICLRM